MKPKIFVFVNGRAFGGDLAGTALAEDGHFVAEHVSSSYGFFRRDMGLTPHCDWQHDKYAKHYPDGYELVEVPREELKTHEGLKSAYAKHLDLADATDVEKSFRSPESDSAQ